MHNKFHRVRVLRRAGSCPTYTVRKTVKSYCVASYYIL